jgi:hypothetical protein
MDAASTTVTDTQTPTVVNNPHLIRVQKTMDVMEVKLKKLQEENVKLKKMLQEYKTANSRVRRIPRPTEPAM